MRSDSFQIDREFSQHMHRLKASEEEQLEANLLRDGCRDSLVVWKEKGLLLDGHNRLRLCRKHSIPFEVATISLPDRRAAMVWILETQLGRRNCSPFERAELALKLTENVSTKALVKKSEQMRAMNEAKTDQWLRSRNPEACETLDQLGGHIRRINAKPNRIYVALDGQNSRAKIGCATDPEARVKEDILKHVPHAKIIRQFYGDRTIETLIHEHLSEYRLNNEWFQWSDKVSRKLDDFLDLSNVRQIETADRLDSIRAAAELAGIARSTIHKAKVIATHANDATKEKLRRGESSINAEYRRLKKEQDRLRRQQLKHTPVEIPDDERVRCLTCGIADAKQHVAAGSVDWIVTDPPYPKEYLDAYNQLADFAAHALKPGGSLLAMVGQSYLPEILTRLGKGLRYHWTLAYLTPGGQSVQLWDRQVNTFWKPLLWLTKGKFTGDWIGDVCRSKVNDNDKRHHHWGQSVSGMSDVLERFVYPGQVVCDPFLGAGTTGIAAVNAGCRFVGLDIDAECVEKATGRIAKALQQGS